MKTTYEHFTPSLVLAIVVIAVSGFTVVNPGYAAEIEQIEPAKIIQVQEQNS